MPTIFCNNEFKIQDDRDIKQLRILSYHGYKKKDLFKFLYSQIKNQNIDNANRWCCEVIITGLCVELYEKILEVYCLEINIKNPLFIIYLWNNFERYTNVINEHENIINTRNNQEIRNITSTLTSILVLSQQYTLPKLIKINAIDILTIPKIRLSYSQNNDFIQLYFKQDDPIQIKEPINEIINHLRNPKSNSLDQVIYWLSWVVQWEAEYIKKNDLGPCVERPNDKIEKIYWKDSIWIIWHVLKIEVEWKNQDNLKEIIDKSYRFYLYYYNKKNRYKKIYLVIFSMACLLREIEYTNIYGNLDNYSKVILACANINSLYKFMNNTG